jgi:hypothetical protein
MMRLGVKMSKKKRAFVRGLWGIYDDQGRKSYQRRQKLDNDIRMVKLNKHAPHHITYVFGKDNQRYLEERGMETRLVDDRPIIWDMDNEQFRHKLEVLYQALQEFDEIVFLDWDCTECKPIPPDFWSRLAEKEPIQAVLRQYHRKKAYWRSIDARKIPEASFVYIRDKQIGADLNKTWEEMGRPWSEEIVMAKYMDERLGGWQGLDHYWEHYNPFFCTYGNCKIPPPDAQEYGYQYIHINKKVVAWLLRASKGDSHRITKLITKVPK